MVAVHIFFQALSSFTCAMKPSVRLLRDVVLELQIKAQLNLNFRSTTNCL